MEENFDYSTNDATRFVDELKDRVHDLYDENKKLKARIEKAIEIINKSLQPKSDYVDYVYGSELLRQELLDTLKGSEKE